MTIGTIVLGLQIVITMSPRMENKSSTSSNINMPSTFGSQAPNQFMDAFLKFFNLLFKLIDVLVSDIFKKIK